MRLIEGYPVLYFVAKFLKAGVSIVPEFCSAERDDYQLLSAVHTADARRMVHSSPKILYMRKTRCYMAVTYTICSFNQPPY